jgi:hypothetical protein
MITFRCKRSGNTISVDLPDDIESMRKHEGYEEVKDEKLPVEEVKETAEKRQVLKLKK